MPTAATAVGGTQHDHAAALGPDRVAMSVADNGQGIAPELLPRIFDPFFSTKDATLGSGLGLAIVHGIVARHGGQIHVETALGQGTCFTVVLPLAGTAL